MQSLERALRAIAQNIEPKKAQKEAAARSHLHLRALLHEGQMGRRIVADYLSGSYARGTATRPLGDVDVIFLIDPEQWARGLLNFSDKPEPSAVLKTFASALGHRYENSSAFSQRRSIRLELDHVHIDWVLSHWRSSSLLVYAENFD